MRYLSFSLRYDGERGKFPRSLSYFTLKKWREETMLAERGMLERLTIFQLPCLGLFDDPWRGELQLRFGHQLELESMANGSISVSFGVSCANS